MKVVATALTILLSFLLSVSVPSPAESCCPPQPESCCASSACHCHVSAPAQPVPASDLPAPAPATVQAPTEGLAPAWGEHLLRPNANAYVAAVAVAEVSAGERQLYALTHAFLI